jgi:hypothetical protein
LILLLKQREFVEETEEADTKVTSVDLFSDQTTPDGYSKRMRSCNDTVRPHMKTLIDEQASFVDLC